MPELVQIGLKYSHDEREFLNSVRNLPLAVSGKDGVKVLLDVREVPTAIDPMLLCKACNIIQEGMEDLACIEELRILCREGFQETLTASIVAMLSTPFRMSVTSRAEDEEEEPCISSVIRSDSSGN